MCFVVGVLTLSGVFIFSGCSEKLYSLEGVNTYFTSKIAKYSNVTISSSDDTLTFSYPSYLSTAINGYTPYNYLDSYYNTMFYNAFDFSAMALPAVSNTSVQVEKDLYDDLYADIDDFVSALASVSNRIDFLAEKVYENQSSLGNTDCLTRLNNLFNAYEDLYQATFSLNATLSNIYYNYYSANPNYDVSSISYSSFSSTNIAVIILSVKNRLTYHISNYTLAYIQQNVTGLGLADEIINSTYKPTSSDTDDHDYNEYTTAIAEVTTTLSDSEATTIYNNETNRLNFYNKAIELYNYQSALNYNTPMYRTASLAIVYNETKNDVNKTEEEELYLSIIDNYVSLIKEYHTALDEMIYIITGS